MEPNHQSDRKKSPRTMRGKYVGNFPDKSQTVPSENYQI